jgi:hypothetical protein
MFSFHSKFIIRKIKFEEDTRAGWNTSRAVNILLDYASWKRCNGMKLQTNN